jgi:CRISPR-associated protein (TIGR02584 family)
MGTSPAVLSECLYYYYSAHYGHKRAFSEIKVLTTTSGRDLLVSTILNSGILHKLEKALSFETGRIPFSEADIVVFEDLKSGSQLHDVRTSSDNEAVAHLINLWVKHFTDDDSIRLTATVAGGRKTQSALMTSAFQLYGRTQDELIHIMVPDTLMAKRDWYFPSDPEDPEQELSVSTLPVLRVGRYLSRNLKQSPDELTLEIQASLVAAQPIQDITIKKNRFIVDDQEVIIPPREASYYRYFLKRRMESICDGTCPGCEQCCADQQALLDDSRSVILDEHKMISGESGHYLRTREKRKSSSEIDLIPSLYEEISRLGSYIRKCDLHPLRREDLAPKKLHLQAGNRKEVSIGIIVDPEIIHFMD